ncbi:TPA: endonuclease [Patescibacteria group bacterium]|nr:endonuclease [Patescibacteria group bacterium]
MYFVYILASLKNNSYYVGSCEDIEERLSRHNNGYVRSTKVFTPWKLVYKEKYDTLSLARKRELQIKLWKSREAIERLILK